jgi:hypothetical protein
MLLPPPPRATHEPKPMMARSRRTAAFVAACAACLAWHSLLAHERNLERVWRITHSIPAPWDIQTRTATVAIPDYSGQTLVLGGGVLRGPGPLDCAAAGILHLRVPAAGLFEGNLPAPAEEAARALGFPAFPVRQIRVTCANATFDFHRADAQTLLVGLDNRVWTLSSAPGALAAPDGPSGVVQRLLEVHFRGDKGFTPATIEIKRKFLSDAFVEDVAGYFDRPVPPDEVPAVNGDPFTDSQEYPTRFAVGEAAVAEGSARVPVRFADAWREYVVEFRLVRAAGGWLVDDVLDRAQHSLRALLQEAS